MHHRSFISGGEVAEDMFGSVGYLEERKYSRETVQSSTAAGREGKWYSSNQIAGAGSQSFGSRSDQLFVRNIDGTEN